MQDITLANNPAVRFIQGTDSLKTKTIEKKAELLDDSLERIVLPVLWRISLPHCLASGQLNLFQQKQDLRNSCHYFRDNRESAHLDHHVYTGMFPVK